MEIEVDNSVRDNYDDNTNKHYQHFIFVVVVTKMSI